MSNEALFMYIGLFLILLCGMGCTQGPRGNQPTIEGARVSLERWVDDEYNVVCYQYKYSGDNLSCVKLEDK